MKAGLDLRSGQTPSLNTGSDSSTAKRSAESSEKTIRKGTVGPCHSRCGTLKSQHCSMAMSVEYGSTFVALHR